MQNISDALIEALNKRAKRESELGALIKSLGDGRDEHEIIELAEKAGFTERECEQWFHDRFMEG